MTPPILIFSDLDATLLDHDTYSFEAAKPALRRIRQLHIPLILVSSKTREELLYYQRLIGLETSPFVVENGSAVFGPGDLFSRPGKQDSPDYPDCMILGKTYAELKSILDEISKKHRYTIHGFHNATLAEVREKTKLGEAEAKRAMNRNFSVPLFFDERAEKILRNETVNYQVKILFGGRFMHLLGQSDKGKAVRVILQAYKKKYGGSDIKSIALGDSLNDEAMLQAVDYSILVRKHDGSYEQRIKVDELIHSPGIGPSGWNQSIISLLEKGV